MFLYIRRRELLIAAFGRLDFPLIFCLSTVLDLMRLATVRGSFLDEAFNFLVIAVVTVVTVASALFVVFFPIFGHLYERTSVNSCRVSFLGRSRLLFSFLKYFFCRIYVFISVFLFKKLMLNIYCVLILNALDVISDRLNVFSVFVLVLLVCILKILYYFVRYYYFYALSYRCIVILFYL